MRICIVGTGYVGLVSAACFAEMGSRVSCVDINENIISMLNAGQVHIYEPGLEELVTRGVHDGRLKFTTSLAEGMEGAEFILITVGTPSKPDGSCDLCYVEQVAKEIGQNLKVQEKLVLVINKSTVPVGTADLVKGIIEKELAARRADARFEVVSNPEFLKEGDAVLDFMKPDRVIVGTESKEAAEMMHVLYAPFARSRDKLIVMGVRSAEMTKYAANCMLAAKISFINEMATICENVGANIRDVRIGIGSDHRIGYHFIYPGVGYGGSCFPKDVKALINTAKKAGVNPSLMNAVEEVNQCQKEHMAKRIVDYFGGDVSGRKLALWGLAFKANTDDMREAASLSIIEYLTARGMKISAFDPVAADSASKILAENQLVSLASEQYEALQDADALLVVTEWNQFRTPDFEQIRKRLKKPALFDGRNLYSPEYMDKIGFDYFCIGLGSKV